MRESRFTFMASAGDKPGVEEKTAKLEVIQASYIIICGEKAGVIGVTTVFVFAVGLYKSIIYSFDGNGSCNDCCDVGYRSHLGSTSNGRCTLGGIRECLIFIIWSTLFMVLFKCAP